jgi:hypothetical protein
MIVGSLLYDANLVLYYSIIDSIVLPAPPQASTQEGSRLSLLIHSERLITREFLFHPDLRALHGRGKVGVQCRHPVAVRRLVLDHQQEGL